VPGLVLLCFFTSGATGLIFEIVWTRQLTLVFGSTTLAISTVLTAFMGGLALGSHLLGKRADRVRDPLRAYALCEGGIGAFALLIPLVLQGFPGLNHWLWIALGDRYWLLSVLRFAASAGLLIVPTTLMGATLPLLARYVVRQPWHQRRVGARVGALYALNTAGAVLGTFVAGFVLLPALGVVRSHTIAACTNIALCALVLAMREWVRRREEAETTPLEELEPDVAAAEPPGDDPGPRREGSSLTPQASSPAVPSPTEPTATARTLVLVAFALSGASAMILQVVWTRALAVVIGSSVYSFTLILLSFLIGLAGGAAACARLLGRTLRPVTALAVVHLLTVGAVALAYLLLGQLPRIFIWMMRDSTYETDTILVFQFTLAALALLPPTLLMGCVFPLTVRTVAGAFGRVGRDVGRAYSINTVGAIVGSFSAGFLVLPLLGVQKGMALAAGVDLALAVALLLVGGARLPFRLAGAVVAPLAAVLVLAVLPRWSLAHFSAGLFRVSIIKDILEQGRWVVPKVLYYRDGVASTVSVEEWPTKRATRHLAMKNNGKVDASTGDDMPTQIMVGALPLLFHPWAHERPPRVAMVGYGSGVSVGTIGEFPIHSLEVVELEPAVYEAARYFDEVNHRPQDNPRIKLLVGDGRNYLDQRDDRYDVLISEPSNPWITGVSNLFTREYFRRARERLAEDGVFCQWAQLYEMSPTHIKTIYRTVAEVFPYVYVFAAEDLSSDTFLLAANRPLPFSAEHLARSFRHERVRRELERAAVGSPEDVLAFLLLAPDEVAAFTAGAPINTDDNALIEFGAPRDLLGYHRYDSSVVRVYGASWPYGHLSGLLDRQPDGPAAARLARALLAHGKRREAALYVERAARTGAPAEARRLKLILGLLRPRDSDDPEAPLAPGGLEPPKLRASLKPAEVLERTRQYEEVERELRTRTWATGLKILRGWPEEDVVAHPDLRFLFAFLLYKAHFHAAAVDHFKALQADAAYAARRPALRYYLGRIDYAAGDYGRALGHLEAYVAAQPADAERLAAPPRRSASQPASQPGASQPGSGPASGPAARP
jgi:spermidine synthase